MILFDYCIYIKAIEGFYAKLYLYKMCNNKYKTLLICDAVIGEKGVGKKCEGDKKTPIGRWKIGNAYGIKENPNCQISYIKINDDMYWCSTSSKVDQYNTLIYRSCNPFDDYTLDEHLIDYPGTYNYFLDLGFNKYRVPYLGSAIFLHCWKGPNCPTSGCVAISENNMIKILQIINRDTIVEMN